MKNKLFFNVFVIVHAQTVVSSKNRLWPTLYLSDEILPIYSANLNLFIIGLTVPRRRKLKTEIFSLKTAGKIGKK